MITKIISFDQERLSSLLVTIGTLTTISAEYTWNFLFLLKVMLLVLVMSSMFKLMYQKAMEEVQIIHAM